MPKLREKYIASFDGLKLLYRKYGVESEITTTDTTTEIAILNKDDDKKEIAARQQPSDQQPRYLGSICLIHGFGEHSLRFEHVCEYFVDLGFVVHTMDLRGHGYSGGGRADGKFDWILKDIGVLLQRADPNLPLYLYGHSMGGLAVLRYMQLHRHTPVCGAIIASPLLKLVGKKQPSWIKQKLLYYASDLLAEVFITSNVDPCGLTGIREEVTKVFHDPLSLPLMTIRFANEIMLTSDAVLSNPSKINTPILAIHGDRDLVTCPKTTIEFMQQVGSKDVNVHIVEGGLHELHNDHNQAHTVSVLGDWLMHQVKKSRRFHNIPNLFETMSDSEIIQHQNYFNFTHKLNTPNSVSEKEPSTALIVSRTLALSLLITPLAPIALLTHLSYVGLMTFLVPNVAITKRDFLYIMLFGMVHVLTMLCLRSNKQSNGVSEQDKLFTLNDTNRNFKYGNNSSDDFDRTRLDDSNSSRENNFLISKNSKGNNNGRSLFDDGYAGSKENTDGANGGNTANRGILDQDFQSMFQKLSRYSSSTDGSLGGL